MTIAPTTEQDFAARMERLGITQKFLGEYVGLTQSTISKTVNESTDGQRTKINEALRELEGVAAFFAPMKPLFDDVGAVKAWLRSPGLPNLFKLLSHTQLLQLKASALTTVNAMSLECEHKEREIEAIQAKTQREFVAWLSESHETR
jgi:hypothetical protein